MTTIQAIMLDADNVNRLVVRKSNDLIEARYRLTVEEQRLVLLLSTAISPEDEDFKDYEIKVSAFAHTFNLEKRKAIYKSVEEAARELAGKTINLSKNGKKVYASWLSYVEYVEGSGLLKLRFDKSLKPYLLQLKKHFTQYNLSSVINFRSSYSIRFYEFLKMETWKAKEGRFEKKFNISEYRSILGIDKKAYSVFSDFRKRVIEPTVSEISNHTELNILNVKYLKTGRKITTICFVVEVVNNLDKFPNLENQPTEEKLHPIIENLINMGFSAETARKYKTRFGVKCIERNIAYAKAKQEAGLVKDFPSYLNQAIKEDMGGAWEIAQTKQEQDKAEKQAQAAKREEQADLTHLKKLAEQAGVPLETLLPKKLNGGNRPEDSSKL